MGLFGSSDKDILRLIEALDNLSEEEIFDSSTHRCVWLGRGMLFHMSKSEIYNLDRTIFLTWVTKGSSGDTSTATVK
jgi:hypothetical protein